MCKLLLIDDSQLDQLILEKLMGKYELFTDKEFSFDAESAIAQLEKNKSDHEKLPDVIFLDLSMPNFDGFDFLHRFNQLYPKIGKNIDIFVITSSVDPKDKLRSIQYRFVKGVLIKPLNRVILSNIYLQYKHSFLMN